FSDASEQKANLLMENIKKTAEAYTQDAANYKNSVQEMERSDQGDRDIVTYAKGFTNADVVIGDMTKIIQNAKELQLKIDQANNCLHKDALDCKRPLQNILQP